MTSISWSGNKLIFIGLSLTQYEDICKIEGPLSPLWVKIKPSLKTVLLILIDAFREVPARDLQKSKISFSKTNGTRAGVNSVTFKLNCLAI